MMKKTIGFNDKKNIWTSKYDYESSNYASLDKQFFSCRKTVEASDDVVCWEHHKNSVNNNFYDEQYSSAISVSFNDNPSQNKLYKSFSLEGTDNLEGAVNTFTTSEHTQPNKQPLTISVGFTQNKGGIIYGHMPKDPRVKVGVNLKHIGNLRPDSVLSVSGPDGYSFTGVDGNASGGQEGAKILFMINESELISIGATGTISISVNDYYTIDSGFKVSSLSEDTALGKDSLNVTATPSAIAKFVELAATVPNSIALYAVTDPAINGDFLRGQYAEAHINLGSDNFELYSMNVNYEPTDLDHSK